MFFSPLVRSTDRREALPRDVNLCALYNAGPKILGGGALPPKYLGPKTCTISVDFFLYSNTITLIYTTTHITGGQQKEWRLIVKTIFIIITVKRISKLLKLWCMTADGWQAGHQRCTAVSDSHHLPHYACIYTCDRVSDVQHMINFRHPLSGTQCAAAETDDDDDDVT